MPVEQVIRPVIINDEIINILSVVEAIKKCDDLDLLKEYLEEVNAYMRSHQIVNMEALTAALSVQIETLEKNKSTNLEMLTNICQQNPKLNGLSIIETSKNTNDSKRDIDYIKYIDENGYVQILECASGTAILDFIEKNPELALQGSAADVFAHFKNHVYVDLEFTDFSDNTLNETQEKLEALNISDPGITNATAFAEEKMMIEEFSANQKNNVTPKIAINSYGERLYTVGEVVIMFHDNHGKRQMEIISGNDYQMNADVSEVKEESASEMTSAEQDSLVLAEEEAPLHEHDFNILLGKVLSNQEITTEERTKMAAFVNKVLASLADNTISYDLRNSLDLYIGFLKTVSELSGTEEALNMRYEEVVSELGKALDSPNKTSSPQVLKFIIRENNARAAFVSVVIIEVTILLGILISVLALVKR